MGRGGCPWMTERGCPQIGRFVHKEECPLGGMCILAGIC